MGGHDPDNPDNCPPKCRACARETRDEHRGPRRAVTEAAPDTKPSWWDVLLACGHWNVQQLSGQHPPRWARCTHSDCVRAYQEERRRRKA
jgi:hypothetical protein